MATKAVFQAPEKSLATSAARSSQTPLRRISPANGRALEILGHAIEYLTDEYALNVFEVGILDSVDPRIEAIQTLMALNRQVYYACPEIEPALRRIARRLFGSPVIAPESYPGQPQG
ncbi:MAG TPA: hypothetical protein VGR96_02035 [Acidobacteriaceae bacterium]|nr:hypothetical protein [Acidobacteriaceae bacterium]